MDMTKDKNYKFILGFIYFFLTFNLLYLFGRGIGLHLNILLQALLVFTIAILIRFLILNPLFLYALLLIATVVILIVENFIYPILPIIIQRSSFLFANIYKNFIGQENIASNHIIPYWCLIIVLITAFTAYILFKKKNIHLLLPLYILVPLIYWYNFYDEAYWTLSIFLILFFILKSLSHNLQENTESPWFKSSLVYGILIISLALVLPKSNKTIYLPWLENKITQHLPIIYELRSYDQYSRSFDSASDFDISITGFQEDPSQLGGPIILSDKKVMSIYGTKKDYFRGKVKHTYTGNT